MTPRDLIAAFETVADAPDGIKRLRELVLQLAVRGRLVPQDRKDEPANVLLDQVGTEKARLARAGKLGAPKPQVPVTREEVAFEIPSSWRWSRFGTICDARLGKMLDKAKNSGELRPYLRNANLQWFRFDLDDVLELRLENDEVEEHSVRVGDLLICEGGEPGRAAICDESVAGMAFQKALHRARPFCGISSKYLAYLLRCDSWAGRLDARFTGATIQHFTGQALREYPVPLPPLAEQHRILARVDELMGLLDRLEAAHDASRATRTAARDAALAALRRAAEPEEVEAAWRRIARQLDQLCAEPADVKPLRQAVRLVAVRGRLVPQLASETPAQADVETATQEVLALPAARGRSASTESIAGDGALFVGAPAEPRLPPGWAVACLTEIARLESGHTPAPDDSSLWGGPFPWIGIRDARANRGGTISDTEKQVTQAGIDQSATRLLPAGTVCVSRTASVGYTVVMGRSMCTSQDFVNFLPSRAIVARYLQLIFEAEAAALHRFSKGAVHKTIYFPEVKAFHVLVPPLAEQVRILAKMDELMGLLDRLEGRLLEAQGSQAAFAAAAVHNLDA